MRTADRGVSTTDLCRQYQATGDRRLRNQVVERHMDVADFYVRRFTKQGVAADDLRQTALLAMIRAVDRFDPDREVEFTTFASRTIEGELKRYFRDRTWAVRPPRRAQELHLKLRRADESLTQDLGRSPTVEELAEAVDADVDAVLEAIEAGQAYRADSVDHGTRSDDDRLDPRTIAATSVDGGYGRIVEHAALADLIRRLPEREREILGMRFFQDMSQPEIAERVGVSQSYLSRVLRRTLDDLRQMAEESNRELTPPGG